MLFRSMPECVGCRGSISVVWLACRLSGMCAAVGRRTVPDSRVNDGHTEPTTNPPCLTSSATTMAASPVCRRRVRILSGGRRSLLREELLAAADEPTMRALCGVEMDEADTGSGSLILSSDVGCDVEMDKDTKSERKKTWPRWRLCAFFLWPLRNLGTRPGCSAGARTKPPRRAGLEPASSPSSPSMLG